MSPPRNKKIIVKNNCLHCPHFATLAQVTHGGKMYCTADLMHEIKNDELKTRLQPKPYEEPLWFPRWCPLEED